MSSFTDDSESEEETSSFTEKEVKKWDQFRNVPPPVDTGIWYEECLKISWQCMHVLHLWCSGSAVKNKWWIRGERLVKILAYIFSFIIVLMSATVSKVSMFFMIKQIALNSTNIPFCNTGRKGSQYITDNDNRDFAVDFSEETEYDQQMRNCSNITFHMTLSRI